MEVEISSTIYFSVKHIRLRSDGNFPWSCHERERNIFSFTFISPTKLATDFQDTPLNICGDSTPSRGYIYTTKPESKSLLKHHSVHLDNDKNVLEILLFIPRREMNPGFHGIRVLSTQF